MAKKLVVFDFDHTILDDNSDTAVVDLAGKDELPQEVRNVHYERGWTCFMQAIFDYLHDRNKGAEDIKRHVENLPPVTGMLGLIKTLSKSQNHDLIIISDSNSLFIKSWLEQNGVGKCFLNVFTNPAVVANNRIKISPYHYQETCKLSAKNLCKGQILDEFLAQKKNDGVLYRMIIYVGDGVNDFCPILHLRAGDVGCVRNSYKLADLVEKAKSGKSLDNSGKAHVIKCELLFWDTGDDILQYMHLRK